MLGSIGLGAREVRRYLVEPPLLAALRRLDHQRMTDANRIRARRDHLDGNGAQGGRGQRHVRGVQVRPVRSMNAVQGQGSGHMQACLCKIRQ